ncbi:MAG: AAA family ATPase [Candidatus Lokiarchaeota archaeon]|nr:AAA family ATPase [Candidatus Lokiarchaeota archaeon]
MKVLGFCGLPGSGKSTAIEAITQLGTIIMMGDVIRNEARKNGLALTDDNLGKIAKELRKEGGDEIVAEKCVELIKDTKKPPIFIDGLRSMAEVRVFRKYWDFLVIAIITDDHLRYQRISNRARMDDSKKKTDIEERDLREIGFGLKEVIKNADYTIDNNSSSADLKLKTKALVMKLIQ